MPESADFFVDEDRLRLVFLALAGAAALILATLAAGVWRLRRAARAPPAFVGICQGLVFTGRPESLASVADADFDRQLSDTVEVLFSRTDKGPPPEIGQFCRPEVLAELDRAYGEAAARYTAGYAQTLAIAEARVVDSRPGYRRVRYHGTLSSRSAEAAQSSPVYLDCTFLMEAPAPLNVSGWRLARADALSADEYYREDRERAARRELGLAPPSAEPAR